MALIMMGLAAILKRYTSWYNFTGSMPIFLYFIMTKYPFEGHFPYRNLSSAAFVRASSAILFAG